MKPSHVLLALFLSVGTAACPSEKSDKDEKSDKKKGKDDDDKSEGKKKKKADDDDDKGESKKKKGDDDDKSAKVEKGDEPKKPGSGRSIAGVEVPAWSKPVRASGKCVPPKADDDKLTALQKGDDGGAGFDDGKGDVAAIVTGMKGACPSAGNSVSQALNTGGYTRYMKKQYAKADGWFARALVADPTNTFARYNLACNLALEGKSEDALWNLSQLVPAAKGGDPRALHYLLKGKADADLDSVRKDPKFVATMKDGDDIAKLHPCPEGEVYGGKDCIKVCNGYGSTGNCTGGKTCSGAQRFGDGLVPYCDDPIHCKPGEEKMELVDDNGMPSGKPACFVKCGDPGQKCPPTKTCNAYAMVFSPTSFAVTYKVCN